LGLESGDYALNLKRCIMRLSAAVTSLLFICLATLAFAESVESVWPEDCLVVVTARAPMGRRAGNGFAIGDGTLVVTAHHLVFEESQEGRHSMAGVVTLFSPYLGEGCDAEIIAADRELDLAVLEAKWEGHPAVELCDDEKVISGEKMEIVGLPGIIRTMTPDTADEFPERVEVQKETLPVDYVAIRQKVPRFISLSGAGQLGDGWSGSPMLLGGTSVAAGCFASLHGTRGRPGRDAQGPAITQVKVLLDKSGNSSPLKPAATVAPRAQDGALVFLSFIKAYAGSMEDGDESALKEAGNLITLRPKSAVAHTLVAAIAEKLGKHGEADEHYKTALELNPNSVGAKTSYVQYLTQHEPDRAIELLDSLPGSEKRKAWAALMMFNVLSERGQLERCAATLTEALKAEPDNAYLWMNLGACHYYSGEVDEGIDAASKGVALLPERGPFRGQLARMLLASGRLGDAETHFRKLTKIEPDNPVVHFWLAQFLAEHRPAAKQEALKEAQAALALPAKGGLAKEEIESFVEKLQSESGEGVRQ
jgi:Flp pilus assembly protein TadD